MTNTLTLLMAPYGHPPMTFLRNDDVLSMKDGGQFGEPYSNIDYTTPANRRLLLSFGRRTFHISLHLLSLKTSLINRCIYSVSSFPMFLTVL